MKLMKYLLSLLFLFELLNVSAQQAIIFDGDRILVQQECIFYMDTTHTATPNFVKNAIKNNEGFAGVLDLDYTPNTVWILVKLVNRSATNALTLTIENPLLDSAALYLPEDSMLPSQKSFLGEGYSARANNGTYIRFNFNCAVGDSIELLVLAKSTEQMLLPIRLSTEATAIGATLNRNLIYGIFIGVILVMFFYNLFVLYATKDRNYFFYIIYILFIGLGQTALSGHLFSLLIGDFPALYKYCIVVLPALSGVAAILFIQQFLHVEINQPKLNKALWVIFVAYLLAAIVRLLGQDQISARMMDSIGLPGAAIVYAIAINIYRKGFKSALYFIIAWTVFIAGVVLFVMRNLGVLPFTHFTTYTLPVGAAIEVALLSFALADKINTLQNEKREKEKEVLAAVLENERLVTEQNINLERKVNERTAELHESNNQLSDALSNLKNTQTQLVEQEKMASLGQLTAGIAHEINNPINFVTSNINPLKRDIKMVMEYTDAMEAMFVNEPLLADKIKEIKSLKEEIEYDYLQEELQFLLKGIDEGAHRTAEIVKGLRIFARNNEDTILNTDLIEGILSTIIILNNQLGKIRIEKDMPNSFLIDCYPGKLNQVFLNLLSNSIYAINAKFGLEAGGIIHISVKEEGEDCIIVFTDNGIGMEEEVQRKIFEPFFTTKPVGQGTGLGMSIVFKTIEMHKGSITITSKIGEGANFKIHLKRSLIFK
jgi:signal transduction histidine kinase